jgi:DinB family
LIDSSNTGKRLKATFENFLSGLRDEDFDRRVEFAISDGPKQAMRLGELMHQAANHGAHHRGQIALLLRMLGYASGNFDILIYYRATIASDRTEVSAFVLPSTPARKSTERSKMSRKRGVGLLDFETCLPSDVRWLLA